MMTDEDQELFLEMLLKLDETHESIKAASKWCRANAHCHEEIVRMWFFAVAKAISLNQRLYLFHLASDILFTAEPTSIQYFSSFLPQIYKAIPFVRGDEVRNDMKKLFSIWQDKKIYNKVVMKRFNKSLKNRNKVVDMSIFKYDKDLLFKNLKRVGDLKPACDYLSRGVDFAPSFDNSHALLSTIKERRACQSLLSSVDAHKSKVTSLVSYMGEMVHLLKMATTSLDLAGNKEQNCVEETKVRILAYGEFQNKVKGILSALEKKWDLKREDYAKPVTPASPEPEGETLYSRRIGTVGVPGDPRLANVPMPPVLIPAVPTMVPSMPPPTPVVHPVVASWGGAQPLPTNQQEEVFHRRDRAGSMTPRRDEVWPEDIPFTNPAPPPLPTDDLPFVTPSPRLPRESLPFARPKTPRDDIAESLDRLEVSTRRSMTPTRDSTWRTSISQRSVTPTSDEPRREDSWENPRKSRSGDEPRTPRVHPPQEDPWETTQVDRPQEDPWDTPRRQAQRDEPWSPRPHAARGEPCDTPRPHSSREEPWERCRGVTPTRDESWERSRGVTPTRDESWGRPRGVTPTRDETWERSRGVTPTRDESWDKSRGVTPTRDESWDKSRGVTPTRDESWRRSVGVTPTRDESWERPRGVTPTRDEPWSPISPLYTGATTWGPPIKKPVYMPCYTGFHRETVRPSDRSSEPFKTPFSRNKAPSQRPSNTPAHRPRALLTEPRPIPRLDDGPRPKQKPLLGTRPPLLPSPTVSPIPSLLTMRMGKKQRK